MGPVLGDFSFLFTSSIKISEFKYYLYLVINAYNAKFIVILHVFFFQC